MDHDFEWHLCLKSAFLHSNGKHQERAPSRLYTVLPQSLSQPAVNVVNVCHACDWFYMWLSATGALTAIPTVLVVDVDLQLKQLDVQMAGSTRETPDIWMRTDSWLSQAGSRS